MSSFSRIEVAGGGDLFAQANKLQRYTCFSLFVYGVFSSLA